MNRREADVTKEIVLVDGRLTPEGRAELIADLGEEHVAYWMSRILADCAQAAAKKEVLHGDCTQAAAANTAG